MFLLVALPALNEEKTVVDVIKNIPQSLPGIDRIEVLVVDDGSTDNTADLAREAGATVISHPTNEGVGAAFQTAVKYAIEIGADIMVNMDADGQFDPEDISQLTNPIIDNRADFVTASRFKDSSYYPDMPRIKLWGNKRIAWLVSFLTGNKYADVACGFRAYSREALLRMNLFGKFTYTQETFLDLAFKGFRIMEVPMKIRGVRQFGKSRIASNLWKYAFNTSKIIFRSFRDYKPLEFFGFLTMVLWLFGIGFGVFLGTHYVLTRSFSPHIWAGFVSGFFLIGGFFMATIALLADMLGRIRKNQEEILYQLKKQK